MNFVSEKILRRKFRTKVFRFYPPGLRITNDGLYKREQSDDGITNSDSDRMWTFKKFAKLIFGFFVAALITGLAVLMILLIIKSTKYSQASWTSKKSISQVKLDLNISSYTSNSLIEKRCKIEKKPQIELNLDKCLDTSVYEPVPIDSQFTHSLGSPILQTVVCYGSKLHLKCPSFNHKLHIHSAYFGIQKNTKNYCWSNPNGLVCYRNLTYHYIRNLCQNKFSCDLIVTDTYFGNPCPIQNLYHNQLLIQYQCFDDQSINLIKKCDTNASISDICPPLNNSNHYQQQWCEPSKAIIKCPKNTLIKIICAYYGIDNKLKCPHSEYKGCPTKCYAQNTISTIQNMCNHRSICFLEGQNSFELGSGLTNACQGFQNMLLIQWECVSNEQTTLQPLTTLTTLPTCSTRPFINASCDSTHSPFVPQPLTNSTQTHFSYPIYQQIVCQGSTLVLVCPSDLVIHIYSAYFGIQEPTRSDFCMSSPWMENPYMFYIPQSFDIIKNTCEYKTKCVLRAYAVLMGGIELNSAYGKQLVVQYQCVNPTVLVEQISKCPRKNEIPEICAKVEESEEIYEQTICDGSAMSLSCGSKRISVVCAFYGVHPSLASCGVPDLPVKPVCYFNSSYTTVKSDCDGKSSCSYSAIGSNVFFDDPCNGFRKALFVQWKCT